MNRRIALLALLGLCWTTSVFAATRTRRTNAANCDATVGPDGQYRLNRGFGLYITWPVEVACPVDIDVDSSLPRTTATATVSLRYHDHDHALGADLRCMAQIGGDDGSWTETAYKYSCNIAGGCDYSTNGSFIGVLKLSLPTNFANGWTHGTALICQVPGSGYFNGSYGGSYLYEYETVVTYN